MDGKPTVNTQGGSVVEGNVTVPKGDFVGRDKITNIFGLTREQTLLLVAILLGVVVTIGLLLVPPAAGPVPLSGDFTIGIAAMGESHDGQSVVESTAGQALGDEIVRQLETAVKEANLDFLIGLGAPRQLGTVTGDRLERLAQARQLADTMNADILVFGALTPGEESSLFVPELYVNPDAFPTAEEAADYFALEPIRVAGNILNNPVSKNELQRQLVSRVEEYLYFSIGLGYLARDNYEMAARHIQRAYGLAYKLQTTRDRTVILTVLGTVANQQGDRQAAYSYYSQAAAIDPDYGRALLGKGQALFLMARPCTDEKINRGDIREALTLYTKALTLTPLSAAEIPSKVALFSGHAHTCLALADGNAEDWSAAQTNYESVRRNYEANPSPLLRYLAAEASGGLALVILREDARHPATAPAQSLTAALAAFEQAADWSRRPHRRAVYLLWQVEIRIARGECIEAQAIFERASEARQSYLEKNPSQRDRDLEEFYQRVQDNLQRCTERTIS